jgi:hypothetical protein
MVRIVERREGIIKLPLLRAVGNHWWLRRLALPQRTPEHESGEINWLLYSAI